MARRPPPKADRHRAALQQALRLHGAGDHAGALAQIRAVLKAAPADAQAHRLAAIVLLATGDRDRALVHAQKAVSLAPKAAPVHTTLGTVLEAMDRPEKALAAMRTAVDLDPSDPEALGTLAIRLDAREAYDESIPLHERALAAATPGSPSEAHAAMNAALAMLNVGRARDASDLMARLASAHPDQTIIGERLAYCLNYDDRATRARIDAAHRRWGTLVERATPTVDHPPAHAADSRRRIAIVSPDLRAHSVTNFLGALLDHLDRDRFELCAWFTSRHADGVTGSLRARFDAWHDRPGIAEAALARELAEAHTAVAIDLSGHFAGHRLGAFASKPAPLQVTWLGYPATTGLTRIDARFVDSLTDPPELDESPEHAPERLVRLDPCFLCYDPPALDLRPADRTPAADGQPFTFASFNDTKKLSPTTIAMWARILDRVPGSRLLLKAAPLGAASVRKFVIDAFGAHAIDPARLELLGRSPTTEEHLAAYRRADLALDTFPYAGTTTTCEALWMGVPVLTRVGDPTTGSHASRVGLSLLTNTGLPELCAPDGDAYIERAVALANDPGALASIRSGLRDRFLASPLCDAPAFARRFAGALEGLLA